MLDGVKLMMTLMMMELCDLCVPLKMDVWLIPFRGGGCLRECSGAAVAYGQI
jgi:hypothetical protein